MKQSESKSVEKWRRRSILKTVDGRKDGRTDGRTTDATPWHKLIGPFGPDELTNEWPTHRMEQNWDVQARPLNTNRLAIIHINIAFISTLSTLGDKMLIHNSKYFLFEQNRYNESIIYNLLFLCNYRIKRFAIISVFRVTVWTLNIILHLKLEADSCLQSRIG